MPVAHLGLAFLGFVVDARRYPGDFWEGQRDAGLEAIVIDASARPTHQASHVEASETLAVGLNN